MTCNVHKEESRDKMTETRLNRNEFLHSITRMEGKTEMIFSEPAADGSKC